MHWSAEVFSDLDELKKNMEGSDDLTVDKAIDMMVDDLSAKGVKLDIPSEPLHDPAFIGALNAAYDLPATASANCVVVGGRRNGEERIAACVVRADTRADVNDRVKRLLDVRKASFLPQDRAVEESGMEYGGINPIGLPAPWRLLLDARVPEIEVALLGSGVRRSKLLVPGRLLAELPGAEVVVDLAR